LIAALLFFTFKLILSGKAIRREKHGLIREQNVVLQCNSIILSISEKIGLKLKAYIIIHGVGCVCIYSQFPDQELAEAITRISSRTET
jgi:hypothetical protein